MARLTELEMVSYRTSDIEHASFVFIQSFAKYSQIAGTGTWIAYLEGLIQIIRNKEPRKYKLTASGIDLWFSGFDPPMPKMDNGKLTFESNEPGFAVLNNDRAILPRERTHVERVTGAIMEEMGKVYHLDVHKNPKVLKFPKELYGKVEVFSAALLTPGNL